MLDKHLTGSSFCVGVKTEGEDYSIVLREIWEFARDGGTTGTKIKSMSPLESIWMFSTRPGREKRHRAVKVTATDRHACSSRDLTKFSG